MRILGILLIVLFLAGGAAWWFRDSLPFFGGSEPVEVSQEAADRAADKLAQLRSDRREVRLNSVELSSLLRYRGTEWVPSTLRNPDLRMSGDTLVVAATIPTDRIPSHPDLDRVRTLLPDTARVEVEGSVRMVEAGRAALEVQQVEFAGIPIPERYYAPMLERLGRTEAPGLAPEEMPLPLPSGVSAVRVEDGYLVLIP